MKKRNIFEVIGSSCELWWKNFVVVLPFVFNAIASVIAFVLLFLIFGLLFAFLFKNSQVLQALTELGKLSTTQLQLNQLNGLDKFVGLLTPQLILYFAIAIVVSTFVLALIRAYFFSGAIAMAVELHREKKTKLKTMANGSQFFWRYFLIELILYVGLFLWLLIFSLPLIIIQKVSLIVVPLISLIALAFLYVLFLLPTYFLVLKDSSVKQAFLGSIKIARKNYWATFALAIIFLLAVILVGLVPWIGWALQMLIVEPIRTIAFVIFVEERTD